MGSLKSLADVGGAERKELITRVRSIEEYGNRLISLEQSNRETRSAITALDIWRKTVDEWRETIKSWQWQALGAKKLVLVVWAFAGAGLYQLVQWVVMRLSGH